MIEAYIKDHENVWSNTTIRSERARLRSMESLINMSNPTTHQLWNALQDRGSYTRLTSWVRLIYYFSWVGKTALAQEMSEFKRRNKQLFRNVYERKTPKISFASAVQLIDKIEDCKVRASAHNLLYAGLRAGELSSTDSLGRVVGKGGKVREVELHPDYILSPVAYKRLYTALKGVGLKPHDLRKIRATDLVRKNVDLQTVCQYMGWSNVNVMQSYVAALSKEELKKFL